MTFIVNIVAAGVFIKFDFMSGSAVSALPPPATEASEKTPLTPRGLTFTEQAEDPAQVWLSRYVVPVSVAVIFAVCFDMLVCYTTAT